MPLIWKHTQRARTLNFFPSPTEEEEDTKKELTNVMENKLGYRNARTVEIQRVHRIAGRRGGSGPRPIIARFLRYKDVEDIISLRRGLEGTDFQMFRDLPQEIIKRRKNQMPTFKKVKRSGMKVSFSKSQPHRLYVNGKFWPSAKPLVTDNESDE